MTESESRPVPDPAPAPAPRLPHAVLDLPSRRWKGEKILRLLGLTPRVTPWRVLEIGTGSGGIAQYLGTHPSVRCMVTSVDVVDLREVHDGFEFQLVAGTALPFDDGEFDVVISNHVIEHVGARAAQLAHLHECRRVLAPTGVGYLAVPNRWMLVEPHYRLAFLSWLPRSMRTPYLRAARKGTVYDCEPLTLPAAERLFREVGFDAENLCVRAFRETIALEGMRSLPGRLAALAPDWLLGFLNPVIPTLIYRLAERARPHGRPSSPVQDPHGN